MGSHDRLAGSCSAYENQGRNSLCPYCREDREHSHHPRSLWFPMRGQNTARNYSCHLCYSSSSAAFRKPSAHPFCLFFCAKTPRWRHQGHQSSGAIGKTTPVLEHTSWKPESHGDREDAAFQKYWTLRSTVGMLSPQILLKLLFLLACGVYKGTSVALFTMNPGLKHA